MSRVEALPIEPVPLVRRFVPRWFRERPGPQIPRGQSSTGKFWAIAGAYCALALSGPGFGLRHYAPTSAIVELWPAICLGAFLTLAAMTDAFGRSARARAGMVASGLFLYFALGLPICEAVHQLVQQWAPISGDGSSMRITIGLTPLIAPLHSSKLLLRTPGRSLDRKRV